MWCNFFIFCIFDRVIKILIKIDSVFYIGEALFLTFGDHN